MSQNNTGTWLDNFQCDVAANLPVAYPGSGNFALYLASDTGNLYVSPKPVYPATAAVWSSVGGGTYVAVPDAATYTVLATDFGKTFIMPNLTANCTIQLPLPTLGAKVTFIYGGVAADAQSWIFKALSAANFFTGGLLGLDTDAGAGSDELVPLYPNGTTNAKLTVATPGAGIRLTFIGDGTHWICDGLLASAAAGVFADLP